MRLPESVGAPLVGALRGLLWRPNLDAIALFSLPLRAPLLDKKGFLRAPSCPSAALRGQKKVLFAPLRGQKKVFFVVLRGPSWTKKVFFAPLRAPSRTKKVFSVPLRGPPWTKKGFLRAPSRTKKVFSVPLRGPPWTKKRFSSRPFAPLRGQKRCSSCPFAGYCGVPIKMRLPSPPSPFHWQNQPTCATLHSCIT